MSSNENMAEATSTNFPQKHSDVKSQTNKVFWAFLLILTTILLVILAVNIRFGVSQSVEWTPYVDLNGDSGISAFKYGPGWIRVRFKTGDVYEYRSIDIGQSHIDEMKNLANSHDGLNSYISSNREVYDGWSRRGTGDSDLYPRTSTFDNPLESVNIESSNLNSDVALSGLWKTSNGDTVRLTESQNTLRIELVESSTMIYGDGVLSLTGDDISGTLTGRFQYSPSKTVTSTFVGKVKNKDRIEYTVDVVHFERPSSGENRRPAEFFMERSQ